MKDTITVAVIGNVTSGKTSFIRTFSRDLNFGRLGEKATTEEIEPKNLGLVKFLDTPGFKNSPDVWEWFTERRKEGELPSPEKIIKIIMDHNDRTDSVSQEVMGHDKIAWEALKDVDAILYLVNIQEKPEEEINLAPSYNLLPSNKLLIIFNYLPKDKEELDECYDTWNKLKQFADKAEFISYDTWHRDFESELTILRGIRSKVMTLNPDKDRSMKRFIENRITDEKNRLEQSFDALISFIDQLSKIKCNKKQYKTQKDENSVDALYKEVEFELSEKIEKIIRAFCNSILYIWGFQTTKEGDDNSLLPIINPNDNPQKFAMSKLVKIKSAVIPIILGQDHFNIKQYIWLLYLTYLPNWITNIKIFGRVSLYKSKPLLESFIPCALDFIKKVRERGFAMRSSCYDNNIYNPGEKKYKEENKISFILPTEPEYVNIDSDFKGFEWKSKKTATKEWIPKLLKRFGMQKES